MVAAFVLGHLALGDMIFLQGAIRYLATLHDEVRVVCLDKYVDHALIMFPESKIKLVVVEHGGRTWFQYPEAKGCAIYTCGAYVTHKTEADVNMYPDCFYDDFQIDRSIRMQYFKIDDPVNIRHMLPERYIFIHEEWTGGKCDIWSRIRNDILIVDPNKNHYDVEHPFYEQAQIVVSQPTIFHRIEVIKGAEELHMVESSYFCLACQLDLSRVKRKVCHFVRSSAPKNLGIFEIS